MLRACFGLMLALLLPCATSLRQPSALSRRAVLSTALAACLGPRCADASTRDGLLAPGSEERCENGEGAACERLAGGNEYVKSLQERSRLNKEANVAKVWDQTIMALNYDEYFTTLDKNMVKLPNGSFAVISTEEYSALRKAGRIKVGGFDTVVGDL